MANKEAADKRLLFGRFVPNDCLWTEESGHKLFASRWSAEWFIRNNLRALVKARAICRIGGKTHVDPPRFAKVAEKIALAAVGRDIAA